MESFILKIEEPKAERLPHLLGVLKAAGCIAALKLGAKAVLEHPYVIEGKAPEGVDAELLAIGSGFELEARHVKVLHWGERQTRRETEPTTYRFSSDFELRSFMDGVEQGDGWLDYRDLSDIDKEHWDE